jgi:hypothetical protein
MSWLALGGFGLAFGRLRRRIADKYLLHGRGTVDPARLYLLLLLFLSSTQGTCLSSPSFCGEPPVLGSRAFLSLD